MTSRKLLILILVAFTHSAPADLKRDALQAIERGVKFFQSTSVEGGYAWYVTPDLSIRWGEGILDKRTVEVQPPGSPSVGKAMLRAYQATDYAAAMRAAKETAALLGKYQNELGGWGHVINLDQAPPRLVSFDDNQTQEVLSFLMALEQEFADDAAWKVVEKGLNLMTVSQLTNGGWPHQYPRQNNYHDYATFNDQGINDCIRLMIEADRYYANSQIKISLNRVARFLLMSQLAPPQPGWAQQYNEYLQPAWARSFEPPSVCPLVTVNNIHSLMDLAVHLDNREYLEPIHDALRWLDDIRLPNGKWARFVEIGTGKALYYDRGRIRVDTLDELSIDRKNGYGYETDLSDKLEQARKRFDSLWNTGKDWDSEVAADPEKKLAGLEAKATAIIAAQDNQGRWITKDDPYKKRIPGQPWNGEMEYQDRISSRVFITNINTLADYIELATSMQSWKSLHGKDKKK